MNKLTYHELSDFVTHLESGGRPKGGGTASGDIPSLGAEHLTDSDGFKFTNLKYIPKDYFYNMSKGIIQSDDILIVKDGATTGKVVIVKENFPFKKAAVNEHLFILRINRKKLHPKFLFYFLFSGLGQNYILRGFHGSAQGGITKSFIDNIQIPLFELDVQRKIASILEKCESAIQKRKEANRLTDEFLKSTFLEMFGDPIRKHNNVKKLSEVCCINPKIDIQVSGETEVSFIPMSAVSKKGEINTLQIRKYKEVKKGYTYFGNDDVLFAKITPCMENGKGAIAKNLKNRIGFGSTEFHVLRPGKEITGEWVYFLLSLKHIRKIAARHFTGTAGQKRVPVSFLKNLGVSVPSLELQQKFADVVQKVEKLKEKQRESEKELDNLFNSLMQKAFRGELF